MSIVRNHLALRWDPDLMWEQSGLGSPFIRPNGSPTRITFGDIDCVTERNGHFLYLEGKRPHEEPSAGQAILFDSLVRDGHTVVVMYGEPPVGIQALQFWRGEHETATVADLHSYIQSWFAVVDELPPRPRSRP